MPAFSTNHPLWWCADGAREDNSGENFGAYGPGAALSPRHWPRASGTTPAESPATLAPATGGGCRRSEVQAVSSDALIVGVIGAVAFL